MKLLIPIPQSFACKISTKSGTSVPELQECRLQFPLKHPNIVNLQKFYPPNSIFKDSPLILILELVEGGDLFQDIIRRHSYTISDAKDYANQLLNGVDYLHKNLILHRDLKPENIFIHHQNRFKNSSNSSNHNFSSSTFGNELKQAAKLSAKFCKDGLSKSFSLPQSNNLLHNNNSSESHLQRKNSVSSNQSVVLRKDICYRKILKIGDFGLAVQLSKTQNSDPYKNGFFKGFACTPEYAPPQCRDKFSTYSFKFDIWSCGVIFYILLTGEPPFHVSDRFNPTIPWDLNQNIWTNKKGALAKDLIAKMIQISENKRFHVGQCLNHSWFGNSYSAIGHLIESSTADIEIPEVIANEKRTTPSNSNSDDLDLIDAQGKISNWSRLRTNIRQATNANNFLNFIGQRRIDLEQSMAELAQF